MRWPSLCLVLPCAALLCASQAAAEPTPGRLLNLLKPGDWVRTELHTESGTFELRLLTTAEVREILDNRESRERELADVQAEIDKLTAQAELFEERQAQFRRSMSPEQMEEMRQIIAESRRHREQSLALSGRRRALERQLPGYFDRVRYVGTDYIALETADGTEYHPAARLLKIVRKDPPASPTRESTGDTPPTKDAR